MSDTFPSVREAVAYALSHRRGPRASRPSTGMSPKGYRSAWDGSAVRACMVQAGITADSPEERELEAWACYGGPKPAALERRLGAALARNGLLRRAETHRRRDVVINEWQDPETGALVSTTSTAREDED